MGSGSCLTSSPVLLIIVLILAALISRILGEATEALVILAIVALNALLGFVQEYRAERAVRALRGLITRTARVWRDGKVVEIAAAGLVRDDVVVLDQGALIPADLRILESGELSVDEALPDGRVGPGIQGAGHDRVHGYSGCGRARERHCHRHRTPHHAGSHSHSGPGA